MGRALKLNHWTARLAALMFGIHPIHVECASWISAGSDSMVAIFYMLAFIAHLKTRDLRDGKRRSWQILSFVLLACALSSKEMALTFALMVALYEWLDRKDVEEGPAARAGQTVVSAVPYAIITAGYFLLRRMALHRSTEFDSTHSNLDVIFTLPVVLFTYLKLLVIPKGITALYYVPYVASPGFRNFVFPLLALLAVSAIIWYWSWCRKDFKIAFLVAWLLLGL